MVLVAPSLLAADFRHLSDQIDLVEQAGAEWLHFDIMDGHFVPNLSFGSDIVRQMRPQSKLFFDVHLMVENPINFLPQFLSSGADMITVHYEACPDLNAVIKILKEHKIKVGISIKPQTPPEVLLPYLSKIDNILLMSVEPGFGGQQFIPETLNKISATAEMVKSHKISIEIDGGINLKTAKQCIEHGADILVAGSAIFKDKNPAEIIKHLHTLGEK